MSGQPIPGPSSVIPEEMPNKEGDVCSYYFWVVVFFALIVSLFNLGLNVLIFYLFEITPSFGVNYMEVIFINLIFIINFII